MIHLLTNLHNIQISDSENIKKTCIYPTLLMFLIHIFFILLFIVIYDQAVCDKFEFYQTKCRQRSWQKTHQWQTPPAIAHP